ncbi:MAG TPA: ROK family protein [Actinopolymorphaceae bacterium]
MTGTQQPWMIGVDVGGTQIKAALLDATERTVVTQRRPTPTRPEPVLDAVTEVVEELRARAHDEHVTLGVAVPGILDEPRGIAVYSAHFGWRDFPVCELLQARTGLPVALGHDVRAACVAEWRLGAGRADRDSCSALVLVTLGTGIGAGIVTDGRLLRAAGYAGQLGHVVVDPSGAECGCGQRGCLTTVASASALVRRYAERTHTELSAEQIVRRAANGDPAATAVMDDAVSSLAVALHTVVTLFGPEIVVLGGGLALAGEHLIGPLRRRTYDRLSFQRRPRIVPAALGDIAGAIGAALLGRRLAPTPADEAGWEL